MHRQSKPERDPSTPEQAFGLVLKEIRKAAGISQEMLADKSGYHRTYIGMLEKGGRSPSLRTIFDLANTLNLRAAQLVKRAETKHRRAIHPK